MCTCECCTGIICTNSRIPEETLKPGIIPDFPGIPGGDAKPGILGGYVIGAPNNPGTQRSDGVDLCSTGVSGVPPAYVPSQCRHVD